MPEPQGLEWRREIQRRLDELEDKVGNTESKVDRLVERQQLQHESNTKKLDDQEQSIRRIGRMLIGEKGDNGLVGSVAILNGKINVVTSDIVAVKESVDDLKLSVKDWMEDIKETFRHAPKTILTVLLILGAIISILIFLGPSIRKAIGLTASAPQISIRHPAHNAQQSTNSAAYTAAMQ